MGKPTAGAPTLRALQTASKSGTLKVNRGGYTTTPQVRAASRKLKKAKLAVRKSRPSVAGLSAAERAVVPLARKAHRRYTDIPTSVLMALTRQESGFDAAAKSSADAQGLTQFIPSTAASYGVQYGIGRREKQSQLSGAAHLLHDNAFASDPQGALSSYSGGYPASDYNNPILEGARDYRALDRPGDPNSRRALVRAKARASEVGLRSGQRKAKRGRVPSVVYIGHQAEKRFGLRVGENPAFGGVEPVHVSGSYHYQVDRKGRGEAIDASGDPAKMMAFDRWVAQKWGKGVTELFYDPGVSIKEGEEIAAIGGHEDHVHVAVALPGQTFRGGYAAGAGGAVFVGYGGSTSAAARSAGDAARAAGEGKGRKVSPLKRYWNKIHQLERLGVGVGPARPESEAPSTSELARLERKYSEAAA